MSGSGGVLTMPRLGETMEEGRIVAWLVEPGQSFRRGEAILEVETDKTVAELPALEDGVLAETLVEPGDTVTVGTAIARLAAGGAREPAAEPAAPGAPGPDEAVPTGGAPVVRTLAMPRLGETMEEGRIAGWLIEPGATVRRGEPIVEIETDKTVAEYPALADGTIVETLAAPGDTLAVGAPLARMEVAAADAGLECFLNKGRATVAGAADETDATEAAIPAPSEVDGAEPAEPARTIAAPEAPGAKGLLRATPVARRFAARADIDLGAIWGSGRRGRIELRDVERRLDGTPLPTVATAAGLGSAGDIAFDRHGRPDAARGRLLLLHGFAGDRTTFSAFGSALARAGFDVLVPDLPAHGETAIEAADVDDLAAPLPAFLDGLGFAPTEIVAHSLGAVAAARLAERLPDLGRLTLLAPAGLGLAINGDFTSGMAARPSPGALRHLLRLVCAKPVVLSDQAVARMAASLGRGRLDALARDAFGPNGQRVDVVDAFARLSERAIVRVVFGLEDRIVPWTQVSALPAAVAIHLVAGAGHMPHWDQPAAVAALFSDQPGTRG